MAISALAGLGNPGARYANTRHNIGWTLVEQFAAEYKARWKTDQKLNCEYSQIDFSGRALFLVKPLGYVNASGIALSQFARYYKLPPASFLVVYDDITLALGRLRVTVSGSAGGHNGVADLLQHFGEGFTRFRIGIGSKANPEMPLSDWVLGRFSNEEQGVIDAQLPHYLNGLRYILREGTEQAMNQLNQRISVKKTNDHSSE